MNIYKIASYAATNRYLGVDSSTMITGRTNVVLASSLTDSQKWLIGELSNGHEIKTLNNPYYRLNVGSSGNCDVFSTNTDTPMIFERVTGLSDVYYIRPSSNSSLCLTAASRSAGANVTWAAYSGSDLQKWQITAVYPGVDGEAQAGTSSLNEFQQAANANYIYDFLIARGFTPAAACGIIGNIQRESSLNPGAWENYNDISAGYGLVQWTPATKFLNWARDMGIISSASATAINSLATGGTSNKTLLMDAQLYCMLEFIGNPGEFFEPANNHSGHDMTIASYKTSTLSPEILAIVFHDHFERSADDTAGLNLRSTYARNWYNALV